MPKYAAERNLIATHGRLVYTEATGRASIP